jgi:hypothetical protein
MKILAPKSAFPVTYALNFAISGLKNCTIIGQNSPMVACTVYDGKDATQARAAYYAIKDELKTAVSTNPLDEEVFKNVTTPPINEDVYKMDGLTETIATYHPNNNVKVTIEWEDIKARESSVTFNVSPTLAPDGRTSPPP